MWDYFTKRVLETQPTAAAEPEAPAMKSKLRLAEERVIAAQAEVSKAMWALQLAKQSK